MSVDHFTEMGVVLYSPLTALEWDQESLSDLIFSHFEFVHENDASLGVVIDEIVIQNGAFLPPFVGWPRTEEICLMGEIRAVNTLEIQGEEAAQVLS